MSSPISQIIQQPDLMPLTLSFVSDIGPFGTCRALRTMNGKAMEKEVRWMRSQGMQEMRCAFLKSRYPVLSGEDCARVDGFFQQQLVIIFPQNLDTKELPKLLGRLYQKQKELFSVTTQRRDHFQGHLTARHSFSGKAFLERAYEIFRVQALDLDFLKTKLASRNPPIPGDVLDNPDTPAHQALLANVHELRIADHLDYGLHPIIGKFTNLEVLKWASSNVCRLPEELGTLPHLERIEMYNNQFSSIPEPIRQLPSLKTLSLFGNPISRLQAEDMTFWHKLYGSWMEIIFFEFFDNSIMARSPVSPIKSRTFGLINVTHIPFALKFMGYTLPYIPAMWFFRIVSNPLLDAVLYLRDLLPKIVFDIILGPLVLMGMVACLMMSVLLNFPIFLINLFLMYVIQPIVALWHDPVVPLE